MADVFLACDEFLCDETKELCFDDPIAPPGSDPDEFRVPVLTHEAFSRMLERECVYSPKEDYLFRLRSGALDLNFRTQAFDWIVKAHTHYCFGPLSLCLSMNYLDRFLSRYELPSGQAWAVQLLSVACLWIAAKMEETSVPQSIELQEVGGPKSLFEAKTIHRMELLVFSTLNWQMSALTPCSFVDYFLSKISVSDASHVLSNAVEKSVQLILCTLRGLHFLEFKPSEIAAAVAVSVAGETQSVNIEKFVSLASIHVQKERVVKCVELIKDLSLMKKTENSGGSSIPKSPNGVLELGYFSSTTTTRTTTTTTTTSEYNITVGSCPNSTHNNKRKKLEHIKSGGDSSES